MTDKKILEENKLIAKFMEEEVTLNGKWQSKHNGILEFQYHYSWNWLMPVVRKIVELAINDDIEGGNLFISNEYTSVLETIPLAIIEDSYKVVIEFIKYYNKCLDSQKTLQKI